MTSALGPSEERKSSVRHTRETAFFSEANTAMLEWRLNNPYVYRRELELFQGAFLEPRAAYRSILAVGVGEGADCPFLRQALKFDIAVGLDIFAANLRICSTGQPDWRFVCGDGTSLPFAEGNFECVYCKDVCHHVKNPEGLIAEMFRVLKPGGDLVLIEANGRNPVIFMQGMVMPHERLVWRTSAQQLIRWICCATGLTSEQVKLRYFDALPLWRVVFHYRFGWPRLAQWGPSKTVARSLDWLGSRLMPYSRWAYLVVRVKKNGKASN